MIQIFPNQFISQLILPVCVTVFSALGLIGCAANFKSEVYWSQLDPNTPAPPQSLAETLKSSVTYLASDIGERNCYRPEKLEQAAMWIETKLQGLGYRVERQTFELAKDSFGCPETRVANIVAEKRGETNPDEILVIGAHYDTKVATPGWHDHGPPLPAQLGTPGANDNGSGIAALLALAEQLSKRSHQRTVRFVAFVNEEPPFFQNKKAMGSWVYAQRCRARNEQIVAMVSLESLGVYSAQPRMKRINYTFTPRLIGLPPELNYVAFLGNVDSCDYLNSVAESYSHLSRVPARTLCVPEISNNVAWSDDWSFWQEGFKAFAVTDTAFMRSDHYHEISDTPDKLDYVPLSHVVWGLAATFANLLSE